MKLRRMISLKWKLRGAIAAALEQGTYDAIVGMDRVVGALSCWGSGSQIAVWVVRLILREIQVLRCDRVRAKWVRMFANYGLSTPRSRVDERVTGAMAVLQKLTATPMLRRALLKMIVFAMARIAKFQVHVGIIQGIHETIV